MSDPTVISTFSGPGGSSLGYERAGYDVRAALDCAPDEFSNAILTTYKKNHPETDLIAKDARRADAEELLDRAGIEHGELDILDGSPPCSPFSKSNSCVDWGDHKSGTLFDRYTYFVEQIQPRAFITENVPGLAQSDTKGYYKILCQNLRDAGYNLNIQQIDTAYLGAGQHRDRLMFIGIREDIGQPPIIEPTTKPRTVRESWDGLDRNPRWVKKCKKACERSEMYKYIKQLPADATTSIEDIRKDGKISGFDYYRLAWEKAAPTFSHAQQAYTHPEKNRYITPSEAARCIGIPDDYLLPNKMSQAWECVIRCLPPVLLETIGTELKKIVT